MGGNRRNVYKYDMQDANGTEYKIKFSATITRNVYQMK
jgi:hypothetical protein